MENLRLKKIINYIKKFLKFLFFEKSWKSDLTFFLFILLIFFIIRKINPYFLSVIYTNSMEHSNFYFEKYEKFNITYSDFEKFPFNKGLNVGDIVVIFPIDYNKIKVGDVVLYISPMNHPIVHRVIYKNDSFICLMGDNNPAYLPYECPLYNLNSIKGKAVFRIPFLGYPRILIKRIFGI